MELRGRSHTVSRILFPSKRHLAAAHLRVTIIPLALPSLTGSSDRPGGVCLAKLRRRAAARRKRSSGPPSNAPLFGLAPCGVLPATDLAAGAVRSYRTFSPLLAVARGSKSRGRRRAVCFLCHFPSGCPDRGLPGALPCGVRTFLSPKRQRREGGRSSGVAAAISIVSRSAAHRPHRPDPATRPPAPQRLSPQPPSYSAPQLPSYSAPQLPSYSAPQLPSPPATRQFPAGCCTARASCTGCSGAYR